MSDPAASLRAVLNAHVPARSAGLVVALSGGADSASLLAALAVLGRDFRALPLRAVHVDHGLQPAAADFRKTCKAVCEQLRVPLRIVTVVVDAKAGESIEAAARDARYAALAQELAPRECLLTAHHRKDQAETILLQALRGAGVKGLSAMPICRVFGAGWHVRPVLDMPRSELEQFGAHLAELPSTDPMNEDLRFDRGFLRAKVWPIVERRWPGAEVALARVAGHMADAQQLLDAVAAKDLANLRDGDALLIPGLRSLSQLARVNAVRLWLCEAHVEPPSTARLTEALRQVLEADSDQLPAIEWGNAALRRYRQRLFLTPAKPQRLEDPRPWRAAIGSRVPLGPGLGFLSLRAQPGGIAAGRLPDVLMVRRRDGGETLKPAQMARTQTLQHLCQSLGVLPWMRDALPLVFAGDALIAVADLWMDAAWRVPAGTPGVAVEWRDAPVIV
jgi:tRNA(Ile)-lysidine synthase